MEKVTCPTCLERGEDAEVECIGGKEAPNKAKVDPYGRRHYHHGPILIYRCKKGHPPFDAEEIKPCWCGWPFGE